MEWILDHYTIFINFGSLLNFGEKIENFSKIKLREIFLFGKNSKKFFFQVWNLVNFFSKKKLWEVLYLMLRSHEKISSRWKVLKLWKKFFFQYFFIFHEKNTIFLCKKNVQKFLSNDKFFFRKWCFEKFF